MVLMSGRERGRSLEVDVEERNFLEGRRAFKESAKAASEAASEAGRKQARATVWNPKKEERRVREHGGINRTVANTSQ